MNTDPISDMLTRIRNAQAVKKPELDLPYSNVKFALAKILEHEGFIEHAEKLEKIKIPSIHLVLKYKHNLPAIQSIQRVSRPGRRVYSHFTDLKSILSGFGISIISTSNGLMTNKEAHARHLGGEILCEVY